MMGLIQSLLVLNAFRVLILLDLGLRCESFWNFSMLLKLWWGASLMFYFRVLVEIPSELCSILSMEKAWTIVRCFLLNHGWLRRFKDLTIFDWINELITLVKQSASLILSQGLVRLLKWLNFVIIEHLWEVVLLLMLRLCTLIF